MKLARDASGRLCIRDGGDYGELWEHLLLEALARQGRADLTEVFSLYLAIAIQTWKTDDTAAPIPVLWPAWLNGTAGIVAAGEVTEALKRAGWDVGKLPGKLMLTPPPSS